MQSGINSLTQEGHGLKKIEVNITSYDSQAEGDPGNPVDKVVFAKLADPEYRMLPPNEQAQIYQEAREIVNKHKRDLEKALLLVLTEKLGDSFSAKNIRIDDTMGVYEGIIEPSYRIQIDIPAGAPDEDLTLITDVLIAFAEKHNQKEFHVSRIFPELPNNRREGEYDPETETTFVRNIEFTMDPDIQNDHEMVNELVSFVNHFAQQDSSRILGYTVVHPKGFTFYMNPDPSSATTAKSLEIFSQTILKLNTAMNNFLKEKKFTKSEAITFNQNVRMLKSFKPDNKRIDKSTPTRQAETL